ncbi:MAG: exopolysaccharide Pel transporter PelG [Planctomycetota bacterium]
MAGIGFKLQEILQEDSYSSLAKGYLYSAILSAGPWLFTIASLALISALTSGVLGRADQALFRGLVIYAYALSLLANGAWQMVASRHLADRMWLKDDEAILPAFVTLLTLTLVSQALLGATAVSFLGLSPALGLATTQLYTAVSALWVTLVFLSAAKDYERIALAFGVGCAVSVLLAAVLGAAQGVAGCMQGFAAGQVATLVLLIGRVLREFGGTRRVFDLDVLRALGEHSDLALTGVLYNLGIWVDKLVFAYAAGAGGVDVMAGLRTNPPYEGAMFLAYLTIVPALALFLIRIETSFFVGYRELFAAVLDHRTLDEIRVRVDDVRERLGLSISRLLKLQGAVTALSLLLGPPLLDKLGMDPLMVMIFRVAVLGAFVHALFLLLTIGLLYLERRKAALYLSLVFCALNGALSWVSIQWGVEWYGYGYLGACLVTVAIGYLVLDDSLDDLLFKTFAPQPVMTRKLEEPDIT